MERKPKAIWSVCAAFTGFRVLLLILDYLDFKYLIPQNAALNETVRKLLTIGKVQYDIAIFITSIIGPYLFLQYCMRKGKNRQSDSTRRFPLKEERACVSLTVLIHVLSFAFFQYEMWTLYVNNPTTLSGLLNWAWKPLLVLLIDYLIAHSFLSPHNSKQKKWWIILIPSTFYFCIIVMDILTSGFMWSSNWRLLFITSFICEMLLILERMIV